MDANRIYELKCACDVPNNNRVGVLKPFGLTFTGTLMILTVKYHLTSTAQSAYVNYLEFEFLMPSNGAVMEPLL